MTNNFIMTLDLDNKIKYETKRLPDESFSADIWNSTFAWFWKFIKFEFSSSIKLNINDEDTLNLPKQGISESCDVNHKRFQEIFQHEMDVKDVINVSMLYVVWQFCKVHFIAASLTRLISIILAITAPLLLLLDLNDPDVIDDEPYSSYNFNVTLREAKYHYTFVGYFICIFGMYYLKSVSDWLSMRTAIRLRTACLASAYTKCLESSMANMVSVHQIINLTAGDSELVVQLIRKGSILLSHTIGIILCVSTTLLLAGAEGFWNMLCIFSILLISMFLIVISIKHFNQSLYYLDKKLIIVEECCRSLCNGTILSRFVDLTKRFSSAISSQYLSFARAEVLRSNFSADSILVILGEFMVLFVDDTSRFIVLVLLNATITVVLMVEWSDALNAVLQGRLPLEKIKIAMSSMPTSVSKDDHLSQRASSTVDRDSAIYVSEATFQWPSSTEFKIEIKELRVKKGQLFGLTGGPASGKSSFILALLGHTSIESGVIIRNGKVGYFPETPYLECDESVQNNVIFHQKFYKETYENALEMVQLGKQGMGSDPVCEDVPVGQLELTPKQMQKISLARSILCDREIIILENPLSEFNDELVVDEIFRKVCAKLIEMGKTVIVTSQNENILRHCHSISLLIDGKTVGPFNYQGLLKNETYQTSLRNYLTDVTISNSNEETMLNGNDITDTLVTSNKAKQLDRRNIGDCCMIFGNIFMQLITGLYCVYLVLTLIFRHIGQQSFEMICLIWLTIFQVITASYMFRAPSNLNKRIQQTMFNNLLKASLERTNETVLNKILSLFMDSHIPVHQIRLISTRCWVDIFSVGIISISIIRSAQGFVIIFVGLIFYCVIYYICRATVSYYAKLERHTREKVLRNFSSQYNGRAVIQSFELIGESKNRVFSLIEENSTAVFMRMSALHFAQYFCRCLQMIPLCCLVSADLFSESYYSAHNQASIILIIMYIFSRLTYILDKLLENYFDALVVDQKMTNIHTFIEKSQTNILSDALV